MKHTKHKLLSSIATLFVCLAMFIGSTYAWFTDSASTGVNKIQAGNLDLVVEHKNAKVSTYETIEEKTNLFKDADGNAMKWEPGAMSWETFKVSNAGSLAFKYVLQTNITAFNKVSGTEKTLKDVLKVRVIPGSNLTAPTRESVAAMDWSTTDTLDSFVKGDGKLYPDGTEGQVSSEEFQVIVYWMPSANDNDWNVNNGKTTSDNNPLFIDFGIKVLATQLEHESDSFDNTYDKNATFSESITTTVDNTKNTVFVSNATPSNEVGKTTTVEFPKETASLSNNSTMVLDIEASPVATANNNFVVGSNGAVGAIDLKATVGDTPVTEFKDSDNQPVSVKVTTYIAKNLTNVTLKYGNESWTKVDTESAVGANKFYYESSTGKMVFGTTHFSTFVVGANESSYLESNNTAYMSIDEAVENSTENDEITVLKDAEMDLTKIGTKNISINLNNHTLSNTGTNGSTIKNGAVIKFFDGNINFDGDKAASGILCVETESSLILDNVTYDAPTGAAIYPKGNAALIEINKSKINAPTSYCVSTNAATVDNYNVIIKINNSDLSGNTPVLVNVPCALEINKSTITGAMHGVVVRGGTATIKDSEIVNGELDTSLADYFDDRNWGQGNMVNLAALTFGNKGTSAYQYPTNVTVKNSIIKSESYGQEKSYPAIYGYGNTGEGLGATLRYDETTTIIGNVILGNDAASINGTAGPTN